MYVRMVWGSLRPGSWAEYEKHYRDRVALRPPKSRGCGNVSFSGVAKTPTKASVSVCGTPWMTWSPTREANFAAL